MGDFRSDIKECCDLLGYRDYTASYFSDLVVGIGQEHISERNIRRVFGENFPGFFGAFSESYGKSVKDTLEDLNNGLIDKSFVTLAFKNLLKKYKN